MTMKPRVVDVEDAMRTLLMFMDFNSIDGVLATLQRDKSGQALLLDDRLWSELLAIHFTGRIPSDLVHLSLPQVERGWLWNDDQLTCEGVREFLRSGDEREHFRRTVSILRADIGTIKEIDGEPVDVLAFPTNSYLTNHHMGAAAAIFRRAGRGLTDHVLDVDFRRRRDVSDAVPTPAFDAGVKRLIHCVGPRISHPMPFDMLARTYANVMNTVLVENLHCVAIASISTGAMGFPGRQSARVALRTLQRFIRGCHWEGKIAIVCVDDKLLEDFQQEYATLLGSFNAELVLPTSSDDIDM
ncbi:hypothetical protein PINS_up005831 [Pythium insidiosum]|nr:hypothetical protein PINS_up005831 [Pythium insidiosum]